MKNLILLASLLSFYGYILEAALVEPLDFFNLDVCCSRLLNSHAQELLENIPDEAQKELLHAYMLDKYKLLLTSLSGLAPQYLGAYRQEAEEITALALSPNTNYIFFAHNCDVLCVQNILNNSCTFLKPEQIESKVTAVCCSPDKLNKYLIIGYEDGHIALYSLNFESDQPEYVLARVFKESDEPVTHIVFDAQSKYAAISCNTRTYFINIAGSLIWELVLCPNAVSALACLSNAKVLIADTAGKIYSGVHNNHIHKFAHCVVWGLSFDGTCALTNEYLVTINTQPSKQIARIAQGIFRASMLLAHSPDCSLSIQKTNTYRAYVLESYSGCSYGLDISNNTEICRAAFNFADKNYFVTGNTHGQVMLWKLPDLAFIPTLEQLVLLAKLQKAKVAPVPNACAADILNDGYYRAIFKSFELEFQECLAKCFNLSLNRLEE